MTSGSISNSPTAWVRGECQCGHDIVQLVAQRETQHDGAWVQCAVCDHRNWLTEFGTRKQMRGEQRV